MVQAQITHHRGGDFGVWQLSLLVHGDGKQAELVVPVAHVALFVDEHAAVAVAVETNAQLRVVLAHGVGRTLGVQGSDAVVDIEAVGFACDLDDFGAKATQYRAGQFGATAVGCVEAEFDAGEVKLREDRCQMLFVVVQQFGARMMPLRR